MFKPVKVGKHIEYIRQKLGKNMLIVKCHPRDEVYITFFLFFIPVFLTEISSSQDEISFRRKRVNSKRQFTIDRDDFIPGRASSQDESSGVNNL